MLSSTMKFFTVILLWFAGLAAATQFAKIAVPFGLIREMYPDNGAGVGWLLTIVSLIGAVLGLVASRWVLQLGAKRMLVASLVIGAIISLAQSTFPPYLSMLFLRTLEGLSHLVIVITAPALISSISGDRYRGLAMSFWSTFFGVSFAVVGWLGMPLINTYGLGFLFQVHGVTMLAIALLVAYIVVEIPESVQRQSGREISLLQVHKRAYASPWISAPAAGWFFYTLTFVAMLAILPEKFPAQYANWMVGLLPIVSIVVSLLFVPLVLARTSGVNVVMVGFLLAIVMLLVIVASNFVVILFIALFATLGLVQGASFASIPELMPETEDQVLAYGLIAQAGNAGNLLGTPMLLAIAASANDSMMYLSIAGFYAVAIATHIILIRRRVK